MFVPLTPLRCLHRADDIFGSRVGVIAGARAFTYAEFAARCRKLADGLARAGIQPGDRVAYLSFNTHPLLEGYFGVPQAGAILLPLNVRLSKDELGVVINHSGARFLIFEDEFAATVDDLRSVCPRVERWISFAAYEDMLNQAEPVAADIFSVDELSIAELFYTSGSTGAPKGVQLAHRTLYLHALDYALQYRNPEVMIDLHVIPLYHANGWGRPQASTMMGTKQILVRRFEPEAVFNLIEQHRATDIGLVPTMANALLNAPSREQHDLSSLRHIHIGGAANSAALVERMERAFQCECSSGYGLTETAPAITYSQARAAIRLEDRQRYERQSKSGWALPGMTLRVVDNDMRDVPRDGATCGEIVVTGDHVMDGYFRDPEGTQAAMSGPWLHTGDMAVWEQDGYINIVDRKKQIIVSGGENISSVEIEMAIAAHQAVLECAVVAAPDDKWGEVPAAIIALHAGESLTEDALLEFLGDRLGRFKLPRIVEFTHQPLPKTGTGKIRKQELRERFWRAKANRVQG
jgi:fatty-acyl-CoA synthase